MISAPSRPRVIAPQEISDDWLIDAARRIGHRLSNSDRPAGVSAWRMLLGAGLTDEEILKLACDASGADPADFSHVSPELSSLLPNDVALNFRVAPVGVHRGVLAIGTVNPQSPLLARELAFACKQRVCLQAANPSAILRAQAVIYGSVDYGRTVELEPRIPAAASPAVQPRPAAVSRLSVGVPVQTDAQPGSAPADKTDAQPDAKNSPASLVDRLLSTAVAERASEAHLEPLPEGGLVVRLRVDGKLNDRFRASEVHAARLLSALKSIAGLNPAETRAPQRGRAAFQSQQGPVDLRLATEPVGIAQERMIVRVFTAQSALAMSGLGFLPTELYRLDQLLAEPKGLVIVAAPPSSGKTATLYAIIKELRSRERRVATIEEPVEYRLEGIQQTQVSESPHPTLASAVRATLKQGADTVLVELPPDPTALEIVVAGGESRFILASLDAPDMASAVEHLYDLDVDPAALAKSLKGIVSQRLVRKLCSACAASQEVTDLPETQQDLLLGLATETLRRPVGCPQCRGTGFAGRTAVAEVVPMTPALLAAIGRRADTTELAAIARDGGMPTLWDSGMQCVLDGTTTLGELLDNVPAPKDPGSAGAQQQDIDALLAQLLGSPAMQPLAAATPVNPPAPAVAERTIRVLVVDDDSTARRTLAAELKKNGLDVIEAADGAAALEYAQRLRPDVIVTEVALPKLDAVGLLQALAAAGSRTEIIVYTSQADESLHAWLREAGAKDIVSRSVGGDALAERLRRPRTT